MPFADYALDLESMLGPDSAPDELYQAGLVYSTGLNVEVDMISAHKWFNLAALRGMEDAKIQRAELADMMSSDEVKQALQSAREWLKLMN
jgi:uncharacterized protein